MKDYAKVACTYEYDVISGARPACQWVRLACERNKRDRARAAAHDADFPYRFDADAAAAICRFAELLPYVSGRGFAEVLGEDEEGRPLYRTVDLQPWQVWILTTLFGWMRPDGLRRFRVALILVPRKNGKSTLGAIVSLFMLTADQEPGAQCYSAATTRDQAKAVAEVVWEMAKRSPALREYYGIRLGSATTRSVSVPGTASKFMPLSADANSLDGLNVSCAVIDELHAHKTPAVWQVIDTATSARQQPLLFAITTAGVDIGGICYQQMGYLEKVLQGVAHDETYFGLNYTIDTEDDYRDPAAAAKANPNFDVSVRPDDLARKVLAASHSPAQVNNLLTKHFNVWVRATSTWMPMREWIALGNRKLTLEQFARVPCWIGIDLAEVRDIAAVVMLFRTDASHYAWFGRYYLPEETAAHSPIAELSGWARDGFLIVTSGNQTDFQLIEDDVVDLCDRFEVREIDFDRALASRMTQNLKTRLEPRMGRDAVDRFVVTVPQNVETMNPSMQFLESLTLSGGIRHDGNPALNWMMSNIVVDRNHKGEIYPRKAGGKDSPNKIDGPVAGLTALSRAMHGELAKRKTIQPSVYAADGGAAVDLMVPEAR